MKHYFSIECVDCLDKEWREYDGRVYETEEEALSKMQSYKAYTLEAENDYVKSHRFRVVEWTRTLVSY